ncbi:iron chaperone [Oricola cellulosilytica]|uniref:DUF1801 domain-containing protein n=1 Tax=Oricola cellulosilytica TaxID=1429082 RepID=A0A4V2MNN9_9HYPH|nr:DUF1801 domain-containing protein [Oricola cellulosilytica]TCD13786.1 DUF1801 domain-containing protein [Oricola cellulosilytica]
MLYDATTPEDYLEQLDDDWRRETLLGLRRLIKQKGPSLIERLNYKMLAYGDSRGNVFHLNAQKHYVSLYVGNASKIDPGGELLRGLNTGKGCIRFTKSVDVSKTLIDAFIERAIVRREEGEDIGC